VKESGTPYIQALTGATISSNAVTTAVTEAVKKFRLLVPARETAGQAGDKDRTGEPQLSHADSEGSAGI